MQLTAFDLGQTTAELRGTDKTDKTSPAVVCVVEGGREEDPYKSGNYWLQARVEVRSQVHDTSITVHQSRVATTFDAMTDESLADTLSAAVSGYNVHAVIPRGQETNNTETEMVDVLRLDIYCCARDISA